MKLYLKIAALLGITLMLFGCPKDDAPEPFKPRPFAEVYAEEKVKILNFLQSHYVTVDSDYNTVFTEIASGGTETPVFNMPNLKSKDVVVPSHGVTYKVYYLELRLGTGESTTKVDSSFVSYKGFTYKDVEVNNVTTVQQTVFDQSISPVWFQLEDVIRGWAEIIPEFKTGTYAAGPNGSVVYSDYGAGVMFVPSALAYYSSTQGTITSYSTLVFNFKLYSQRSRDHDRDGFLSKDEYGDFDASPLDTDGDGIPDYLDMDDDNDGYTTKREREIPNTNPKQYYDWATMPTCNGGKKVHLDASCKPN